MLAGATGSASAAERLTSKSARIAAVRFEVRWQAAE
jgi:hypothetical protein